MVAVSSWATGVGTGSGGLRGMGRGQLQEPCLAFSSLVVVSGFGGQPVPCVNDDGRTLINHQLW
jgi:hypothetical protein